MKDIEGLEKAILLLKPSMPRIEEYFISENAKFKELFEQDYSRISRVLKCHLITESYINKYISIRNRLDNIEDIKLSFSQKMAMLPTSGDSASFVKPGIFELNKIRNKYSHNLDTNINLADISAILEILKLARPSKIYSDPLDAIEDFTTVACTWLLIGPQDIIDIMQRAFKELVIKNKEE